VETPEPAPGRTDSFLEESPESRGDPASTRPRRFLRAAYLLTPLFGIWFLSAELAPSPVGVYVPGLPILAILFGISGLALLLSVSRASPRWSPTYRASVAIGVVAGIVVAGGLAAAAVAERCPYLPPTLSGEPGGWGKADAPLWRSAGAPVLFFYGSAACPFCSASSWAILGALERLGNVSGLTFDRSSPNDVFANTPEVVLADLTVTSAYVRWDAHESTNDNQIVTPSLGECIERAYVSAYSGGAIPFVVVDGIYVHTGALVDPAGFAGQSASALAGEIASGTGTGWTLVASAAYLLIAFLVKTNGGEPSALARNPAVAADLAQIG
jgi:hypothetical protein